MTTKSKKEMRPQIRIHNRDVSNVIGGGVVHLPWVAQSKGQQYV